MLRDVEKTIGDSVDKRSVSFISSMDESRFPNTKVILPPREREGTQAFYLTTNTSSMQVSQYCSNPEACICFYDRRFFRGVMLIGTAEVLEDVASKEMTWQEGDTQYYSKGVTDPDYYVLRFTASAGRYYANFKSENFSIK